MDRGDQSSSPSLSLLEFDEEFELLLDEELEDEFELEFEDELELEFDEEFELLFELLFDDELLLELDQLRSSSSRSRFLLGFLVWALNCTRCSRSCIS